MRQWIDDLQIIINLAHLCLMQMRHIAWSQLPRPGYLNLSQGIRNKLVSTYATHLQVPDWCVSFTPIWQGANY